MTAFFGLCSMPMKAQTVVSASEEEEEVLSLFGDPTPAPTATQAPAPASNKKSQKSSKSKKQQPEPVYSSGFELVEDDGTTAAPMPEAQPAPSPKPKQETGLMVLEDESEPEPAPVFEPEPAPAPAPEPVKEPEPDIWSKPELEPEPVFVPEPEPEPVFVPEPAPEKPRKEIVFRVSKAFLEFPEFGGDQQIEVTSDEAWSVSESPKWITAQRKGNSLSVKVARNERFSDREGDIVLTNENEVEIRIVVAQGRNSDYLNLSAQLIDDTEGDGGRYTIKVSSNKAWATNRLPAWCTVENNGATMSIHLDANNSGADRQAQIEVSVPQSVVAQQVITVKQSPIHDYITVTPNLITSSGKASAATIKVASDKTEYRVENLPYWCTVKQQTATSFVIEIADNSGGAAREAECNVRIEGGKSDKLIIRQEERLNYITVSPKIIKASKRGGIITVKVQSSGAWRVVNLPDWCQVTEETGTTFTLSIDANPTDYPRTAEFSVSTGGVRDRIEIKQE